MAELVDALDSGSSESNLMGVQVPLRANLYYTLTRTSLSILNLRNINFLQHNNQNIFDFYKKI